ncbi:hypothetical protein PVAG01_10798 [Phlyctema vagabunda]|uniref:Uncharacterized protein n=1 Tax=Phlyctema vagabunda TaxID=108571 RepID=A0ABR4P3B3_9HELO
MAASLPSIAELVTQMHENVTAIHQRLSLLSNTKEHDDAIERLENERLQRLEEFRLQQEKETQKLAVQRKKAATVAADKWRIQREQLEIKRKQDEDEVMAARKREEEEMMVRRKKEDEVRQAMLEQEEEEIRMIEQQEEEQWSTVQAKEDEKRRLKAEELETGLHDEVDAKMIEKEEEMERRILDGQKALRELDEKRKAINALIDAQINGNPIIPTFRRGSRRYSTSPLAANVAAMLARGESSRNDTDRAVQPVKVAPKHISQGNEFARRNTITEEIDLGRTTARKVTDHESSSGNLPFPAYEEAPDRLHNPLKSTQTPNEAVSTTSKTDRSHNLPLKLSVKEAASQEPRDENTMSTQAARKMDAIVSNPTNIYSVTMHKHLPTWANQADLDTVSGCHGMLQFHELGADLGVIGIPLQTPAPAPENTIAINNIQHQTLPTWADQSELSVVSGSHGSLVFREGGADLEVVKHPQASEALKVDELARYLRAYQVIQHRLLPTWVNQAKLSMVQGSHGVLAFGDDGADMAVVETPKSAKRASILRLRERADTHRQSFSKFNVIRHMHLPTWVDQATLALVRGSHGQISFRNGGADMIVVRARETQEMVHADKPASQLFAPDVIRHSHFPTWADQASLPVVRGAHGQLVFNRGDVLMNVVEAPPAVENAPRTPFFIERMHSAIEHQRLPTWADQANLPIVYGNHGQLAFGDSGADMIVVKDIQAIPERSSQVSISIEEVTTIEYNIAPHRHLPTWADQKNLSIVEGAHGVLAFNDDGADMNIVNSRGVVTKTIPAIVPEAMWFSKPKASADSSHSLTQSLPNTSELASTTTSDVPSDRSLAESSKKDNEMPGHIKQRFPFLARRMGARQGSEIQSSSFTEEHVSMSENTSPVVEQVGIAKNLPNGLGNATMNHGTDKRPTPPTVDSMSDLSSEIVEVAGEVYDLEHPALEELVQTVNHRNPHPYWVDQATLKLVKGSHGTLKFIEDGAELTIIEDTRVSHAYWAADQAVLDTLRGSHALLNFTNEGSYMTPFIAKTSSGIQASVSTHMLPLSNAYWAEDQSMLQLLRGQHGVLHFQKDVQLAYMDAFPKEPSRTEWIDQAQLEIIKGNHATLYFSAKGAHMVVARSVALEEMACPSSTARNPYWVDQSLLEVIRGSHATLVFRNGGAEMNAQQAGNIFTTAETGHLKSTKMYWVDQATLEVVRGTHGILNFHETGASLKAVQSLPVTRQSPVESVSLRSNSNVYWVDQAKLEIVNGSHGGLAFSTEGAYLVAYALPLPEPQPSPKNLYWIDQADLGIIRGNHGVLSFHESGAIMTPNNEPIAYFKLETDHEDLTDMSSQSSFISYTDSQDEIAQLVARDVHHSTNPFEDEYLSDVPEIDSELDGQSHKNHEALSSPAFDAEEWAPRSLDDVAMPVSERSVPNHQVNLYDIHDEARRGSEHALFGDIDGESAFPESSHSTLQHPSNSSNSSRSLGTYSSFGSPQSSLRRDHSLHIRTDTADTLPSSETYESHDAHSPMTPTDSDTSPIHEQQGVEEPIIRSVWPESTAAHEIEYESYEPQEMKAQASPHPTQTEFDPFNPQVYTTNLTEHTQRDDLIPTPARVSTRPISREFRSGGNVSPSRPLARRGTVSDRINSFNGGQASVNDNVFQKTRALFESASSPTTSTGTRPVSGIYRSNRSSFQPTAAPNEEAIVPRSLDSIPRPPSPIRMSSDEREDRFRKPAQRSSNLFYGALSSVANGISSSIYSSASTPENTRLLGNED